MYTKWKGPDAWHYVFQISKTVVFEVNYYILGNNKEPYFSTSANEFIRSKQDYRSGGQAQERLLPHFSPAYKFYKKWNPFHLQTLTDERLEELRADIIHLRWCYNSLCYRDWRNFDTIPFRVVKELSMLPINKNTVTMITNGEESCYNLKDMGPVKIPRQTDVEFPPLPEEWLK